MKRYIAILLSLLMIVTMLPVAAMGATMYHGTDFASGVLAKRIENILYSGISESWLNKSIPSVYDSSGNMTNDLGSMECTEDTKYSIKADSFHGGNWSGWQCAAYGYATFFYLFGFIPNGDKIDNSYIYEIDGVSGKKNLYYNDFVEKNIRCGAYVRTTPNSSGTYNGGSGHSFIILGYNQDNVIILEGNYDSENGIKIDSYSWNEFNSLKRFLSSGRYVSYIAQPTQTLFDSLVCKHEAGWETVQSGSTWVAKCKNCGAIYNDNANTHYSSGDGIQLGVWRVNSGSVEPSNCPYKQGKTAYTSCLLQNSTINVVAWEKNAYGNYWLKTDDGKWVCYKWLDSSNKWLTESIAYEKDLPKPVAPTGLTYSGYTGNSFTISWSPVSGATSYKVEYKRDGIDWRTSNDYSNHAATSYVFYDATNPPYYIRVKACNAYGESDWSATMTCSRDHTHSWTTTTQNDAYTHNKVCSCGAVIGQEAHSFGGWVVTKAATVQSAGTKIRSCTVCGYQQVESIPQLEHRHQFGSAWEYDELYHWHECSCGEKSNVAEHTFVNGECTVCGYSCIVEGLCGTDATWRLDTSTGILTINGTGNMDNWDPNSVPWSQYCLYIKSLKIDNNITNIGKHAFYNCTSLTSIAIGNSVKRIGDEAFAHCSALTSITMPDSVTTIDVAAFYGCTSLASVVISNSVTSIGTWVFYGCTSLTSVIVPDGVTNIDPGAFEGCTALKSVIMPDSVVSIGTWAFDKCSSLTDVYYSGSITDWQNISISSDNDFLTNATIHYNSAEMFIPINAKYFPDDIFRNGVVSKFDNDKDGQLSETECNAVTEIQCGYSAKINNDWDGYVSDLTGIEYFTHLERLYCGGNPFEATKWDIKLDISQNAALTELYCTYNNLVELDVSQNTALTRLDCSYNNLAELDVSQNTALTKLFCSDNNLTELDVSQNTKLEILYCNGNNLTLLDVSGTEILSYDNWYLLAGQQQYGKTIVVTMTEEQQTHYDRAWASSEFNQRVETVRPHEHTYDNAVWHSDATRHWHECECGDKSDVGEHSFGKWNITDTGCAHQQGSRSRVCTECGYVETQTFEGLAVAYTGWWNDSTHHWHECSCGETENMTPHDFGEWEVVTPATEDSTGLRRRVCQTCEWEETEEIPALVSDIVSGADLNNDGDIDEEDLTILTQHVAKIEPITDAAVLTAADVNGDGAVDAADLTMLLKYIKTHSSGGTHHAGGGGVEPAITG